MTQLAATRHPSFCDKGYATSLSTENVAHPAQEVLLDWSLRNSRAVQTRFMLHMALTQLLADLYDPTKSTEC
jgi:hypothetical protein